MELEEARRLVSIWVGADREKEQAVRMLVDEAVRAAQEPVPGVEERGGPYTLTDVGFIEGFRGRAYPRLRATVEALTYLPARLVIREGQVAAHYRVGLAALVNSLAFALGRQDWGQVGTVLEKLKALAIELPPEEGR